MSFIDYLNEAKTPKKYQPKDHWELRDLVCDKSVYLGDIDTSKMTDMSGGSIGSIFANCKRKDWSGIETWDVSNVINMAWLFCEIDFNGDISKWDVSKVENMSHMFYESKFNGNISKWNVSKVKNMEFMFARSPFNKDISKWNVSKVENMSGMFRSSDFNRNISKWDVSKVKYVTWMIDRCPIKPEYLPDAFKTTLHIDD